MLVKFKCPRCESENSFTLSQDSYTGAFRCWKCKSLFTVQMEHGQLKSWLPLSEEEFQQSEAARKAARGL